MRVHSRAIHACHRARWPAESMAALGPPSDASPGRRIHHRRNPRKNRIMKFTRTSTIATILATVAIVAAAAVYVSWPRGHADMVAQLAAFVASEGPWDNEWDKAQEKLRDVLALIKIER